MDNPSPNSNAQYLTQLLDKIGAPLLSVIENVASEAVGEEAQIAQAQIMAQLLGQSVAMSTMLYNALDLKQNEQEADETRLALASLVSPFIAEFYLKRKKVPKEDNLKRMIKSLEAVLLFGENFKPASAHKSRLKTLDQTGILFDESQPVLVMLQAMVPVVNAVEEFSFGKSRRKTVQEISSRLEAKSAELAQTQKENDKLTQLLIFKSLAAIYADCHRVETRLVLSNKDSARDNLSVEPIWERFNIKMQMLEALMGVDASGQEQQTAASENVAPSEVMQKEPVEPSPVEQPSTAPVMPPQEQAQAQTAVGAGPMGFFKKEDTPPTSGAAVPPVETSAQPASPPAVAEQEAPATTAPPPLAPEDAQGASAAGPMGFFKKKPEGEEG